MIKTRAWTSWLPQSGQYVLLPFKFHPLNESREVLVSEAGDFLVCPRGTAERIASRKVEPSEPLFEDLLSRHFLSVDRVPSMDVLAARFRARKGYLDSFTALHIIVITLRCNFSCHYCQVSRKTEDRFQYDITEHDLDASLDLIFQTRSPDVTIEFQGGEPLAAFDRIQYAIEGALKRNADGRKRLRFVICTNLSLVTDEILEYCKRHDIVLSTSLDGPAALHEANRPAKARGDLHWLSERIAHARRVLGDDRVSALMTTSKAALNQPEAIVDSYRTLGFNRIFFRPIQPYGFAERLSDSWRYSVADFLQFYKRGLAYILELNRKGETFVEDYTAILMRRLFSPFPTGYVDLQSPTGLVTAVAVYNYDGSVYASDESRMLAEAGDTRFRLGHVSDSYHGLFYGENARNLVRVGTNEGLAGCADCGLQAFCGSDIIRNWRETGDLYGHRPTSSFCELNMGVLEHLFELVDADPTAERILRRWALA